MRPGVVLVVASTEIPTDSRCVASADHAIMLWKLIVVKISARSDMASVARNNCSACTLHHAR